MVHDGKNTTGEKDAANLEAKSIKENLKDRKSSLLSKAKKLRLPPRTFFSVASPDGFYKRLFELDSRSGSTSSAAAKVAIEIMEDAVDDAEVSDKGKGNIRKTSRGYAPKVVHKKQLIGETLEKFPKEKPVYRSSRLPSIQQVEHPADIRRKAEITYTPPGTIHQRRDTQKRRKRVSISMEPVVKSVVPEPPKITDLTTGKAILPEVLRGGSVTSMVSTQSSIATEAVVRSSKVARRGPQETQESPSGSFTRERGSGRAFRGSRTSEVSRIPRASRASRASREIPRKTEWMARELVEEMAGDTAATHDLPPLGFQYFTRDIDNLFGTQYTAEEAGEWPAPIQVRRSFFMGRLRHTCDTPWTRPEYDIIYKGGWGPYLNAEGQGRMTRPNQVEYEGDFQDGMCHGAGALHYPNAAVIHGTWERGHLIQPMYISKDGLSFEPNGDYCRMPDRRYFTEVQKGLRPAGRSQLTNQHPPRRVPPGCYDAGDGIFDPRRNAVYDPDTGDVVRVPTKSEMEWIKKHCRKGWDENVGYRPDLYENWFEEPKEELEKEGEEEEWIGEVESSLKMESSEEGKLSSEEMEEQEEQKPETDEAKKETGVPIHYPRILPPVAVQDVALDAAPPVNIFPRLFPETEGDVVPESTKDKLMIPIDTYIAPENMDVSGRYQAMLEDERRKQEKKEKRARERERRMAGETVEEGKKEEVESATSTPRLSLDDFDEIYKGPWRQMARRLVPLLRNRLEEDRKLAAAKWQEDLMQLLSERATHAGLEMSTSGYKGMAQPGPEEKRRTTPHSIIPPGLEERARQRRAERQERLRQEEEKRIQQQLERERRQAQAKAAVEKVASPDDERVEDEGDTPRRPPRRVSVLPSSAMAAPKGRESLAEGPMQPVSPQPVSPESPTSAAPPPKPHQRPRSSEGKKSLAFKDD